jgi:hypothetical protein
MALVRTVSKIPEAQRGDTLGQSRKMFFSSLGALEAVTRDRLNPTQTSRLALIRARSAWQVAVTSAHLNDWELCIKGAEEYLDADPSDVAKNRKAAWKLQARGLMAKGEFQQAMRCLVQPELSGDAAAAEMINTCKRSEKARDSRDKKAWGKALERMGSSGAMSAGRDLEGKVTTAQATKALESVFGDMVPSKAPELAEPKSSPAPTAAPETADDGTALGWLIAGGAVVAVAAVAAMALARWSKS